MLKYFVLTTLVFVVVFGLLVFAVNKLNLKKPKRPLQLISGVVLCVFVLLASLFMSDIVSLIDSFLQLDFIRKVVSSVFGAVPAVYLTGILLAILILNILFMLAGIIIKLVLNLILRLFRIPEGKNNPFARIINRFYENDIICVTKPNAIVVRKWLNWAKNCVLVLFALMSLTLMTLVFFYPGWMSPDVDLVNNTIVYLYWFPLATYLILNEFYYFLNGVDVGSEDYDFETEALSSIIVGDYAKMVQVYEETAGDANLIKIYSYYNYGNNRFFNGGSSVQTSMCDPEMVSVYNMIENNVRITGVDICDEYANGLVSLLNGRDVFFADSIIGEVSLYLFNYLNYQLCCGKKIVVLCRSGIFNDTHQRELYLRMLKKSFRNVNGQGELWKVGTIENILNNEHVDVLLSSYSTYIHDYSSRPDTDFFDNIRIGVFADCLELFSDEQFYKSAIISQFESTIKDLQYIFLSESNSVSLKNAVINIMGEKHSVDYYRNSNSINDAFVFLWKGESFYKPQMVFDADSKYYYGNALPLGIIGAKYGVEKVSIINCENTPYRTYHRMMKERSAEIEKAINTSINFDAFFSYEYVNYYLINDLVFLIVYDKYNNAAICKDVWGRITDNKTKIIHIISEPYMLREFLCYNIDDVQIAEAVVPYNDMIFTQSEAKTLIINMFEFGVKLSDIRSFKKKLNGDASSLSITDTLEEIFALSFPDEPRRTCSKYFTMQDDVRFDKARGRYDCERVVRFVNSNLFKKLVSRDQYAKLSLTKFDKSRYLPILKSDIDNYYLEDQFISVDGESVQIVSIDHGEITVKHSSETNHYDYVPVCSFDSRDFRLINDDNSEDAVYYLQYGTSTVTRRISDYYSLLQGRNLTESVNCTKHHMSSAVAVSDSISGVQTLIIRLNYAFADNAKAAALFAELLNGLFRTLFPTSYQNIVACANTNGISVQNGGDDIDDLLVSGQKTNDASAGSDVSADASDPSDGFQTDADGDAPQLRTPDAEALLKMIEMIPCDNSCSNDGCVVTVYEFCHKEMGLVYELKNRFSELLLLLHKFLSWDISRNVGKDNYLKYGFDVYPDIFPVEEMRDYLEAAVPRNISISSYNTDVKLSSWTHCEYCFKPIILTGHKLSDNRLMCNSCFNCRITAKQEVEELFVEVIRLMTKHYLIDVIPKGDDNTYSVSVKFKRRSTINRKINNQSPFTIVLGFYNPDERKLWIERGGPKPATFAVLAHELTHAWQHDMFDLKPPSRLLRHAVKIEGIAEPVNIKPIHIWEGQATYVEIELMRVINQHEYADHLESNILSRSDDDIYKIGYLYFVQLLKASDTDNIFEYMQREGKAP